MACLLHRCRVRRGHVHQTFPCRHNFPTPPAAARPRLRRPAFPAMTLYYLWLTLTSRDLVPCSVLFLHTLCRPMPTEDFSDKQPGRREVDFRQESTPTTPTTTNSYNTSSDTRRLQSRNTTTTPRLHGAGNNNSTTHNDDDDGNNRTTSQQSKASDVSEVKRSQVEVKSESESKVDQTKRSEAKRSKAKSNEAKSLRERARAQTFDFRAHFADVGRFEWFLTIDSAIVTTVLHLKLEIIKPKISV